MNKQFLFLVFFTFSCNLLFGQALSGVYTIGSGGTYPTITTAVNDLTTNGVSGQVTMNILPGTYNETITIGAIAGASTFNHVLFKSSNNDSSSVIINYTLSASQQNVINLLGATHVRFKHLTISKLGTYASPNLITIGYQSSDIQITNCKLTGGKILLAPHINSNLYSAANNVFIENNLFENTPNWFIMSNGFTASNFIYIRYNQFTGTATHCMSLAYIGNVFIVGNQVTTTGNSSALTLTTCTAPVTIEKNKFTSASNYTIDIVSVSTTSANRVTIKNNMISNTTGGCLNLNSLRTDILYNTFKTLSPTYTCLVVNQSTNQVIRNNIFESVNGICINYMNNAHFNNNNSNNAYYNLSGLPIKLSSNTTGISVAQFQSLFPTIEANSVFGQPVYLNPNDLHLGWSFPHDGTALPIASITTDIDGQTRSATIPDIGADEFSIPTGNNNDITILKIISPDSTFCQDQDNLLVRVKNNSLDTFTYFTGKWYLNNTIKNSSIYPVYILPGDSAIVNFGTFDFNEQTFYKLKFEAIFPNGLLDILPSNGVKSINYYYVNDLEIKEKKYLECSTQKELSVPQLAYGNYVWSNGQTTNKIVVTSPGIYSISLQYMGSCTVTDSITIN
jgi:hypothetical protein